MTRFAICDTDEVFLEKLAEVLHSEFEPCSVEYMYGPTALEASLQMDSGGADVLLTEIVLRNKNAIDIVKQHMKPSSPLQVVYLSSKMEFCTDVYETRHCGFLVKPVKRSLLLRTVDRAIHELEDKKRNGVVIQKNGSVHITTIPSLCYVESHGHVIRVITDDEVLETYGKLATFLYQLDNRFIQCHKSYVVNMDRVKHFNGESFLMDNGDVVPISQSKRKEVRRLFLDYFGTPAG